MKAVCGLAFFAYVCSWVYMASTRQFPLQQHDDRLKALETRVDKLERK
jgi:hypothetical protein